MVETMEELCEKFLKLEKKHNLNQKMIKKVYYWQLLRMELYNELSRKTGIYSSVGQQTSLGLKDKVISFIPFLKNSLLANPFKGKYQKDILIFDHPRKVKIENVGFQDIYSYFLSDVLNKNEFELIETPYLNQHTKEKKNYIKYNDKIILGSYFNRKISFFKTCETFNKKVQRIEEDIEKLFNVKVDLYKMIQQNILRFKYEYKQYDKLFKKRKPKLIFVVVGYENKSVISAAKDNNIPIYELQHGVINKFHMGYHYPNDKIDSIIYFPDKLLSFGEYWNTAADYPISKENIIPIGFQYLENNASKYLNNPNFNDNKLNNYNFNANNSKNNNFNDNKSNNNENNKIIKGNEKNKKQIIVISQRVIGKELSKFAYESAKSMKENNFVYKLHPEEYFDWKNNYEYLNQAAKLDNFQVVDTNDSELYELMSKSYYQLGVFSTAIYEGLYFGCKTFVLNIPGVEYLDDLYEKNYIEKVNTPEELIEKIQTQNLNLKEYDKEFFFKKYNKEEILKIININNFIEKNK
ncbi:MAG: sialyltransferase [Methanobrevibacter sp.]|jgi:hypothetical protein|nr:sialyltransferase [Methanobrevibacter sp.]